jgi:hypothetical protein
MVDETLKHPITACDIYKKGRKTPQHQLMQKASAVSPYHCFNEAMVL